MGTRIASLLLSFSLVFSCIPVPVFAGTFSNQTQTEGIPATASYSEPAATANPTIASFTATYSYDTNGRRLSSSVTDANANDTATYTWNKERLSTLTKTGTNPTSAAYTYGPDGMRTKATVTEGGQTTTYAYTYEGNNLIRISATGTSAWSVDYLYGTDGKPAQGLYRTSTVSVAFRILTNERGDVLELADGSGMRFAGYSYGAYGNLLTQTVYSGQGQTLTPTLIAQIAQRQPLRYAGYVYDTHSGLYYLAQRYYDAIACSFLSPDVAKADGEKSAYLYCAGDPIGSVDPSGEFADVLAERALNGIQTIPWDQLVIWLQRAAAAAFAAANVALLTKGLVKSYEANPPKKTPKTEVHHIVAQVARAAESSRRVLKDVGISVDSKLNKVELNYNFHKRLHRKAYFDLVNAMITRKRSSVSLFATTQIACRLTSIKVLLKGMNLAFK
jgi:RHS repeat-associated protein